MTWTTRPRSKLNCGLSAIREGDGEPVVLIHGVGLNADSWGAQIGPIAKTHAVIAPDMPGHGESPKLDGPVSLETLTDRIAETIAEIGQPVPVIGHSLGALITLSLALRYPDLCSAIAPLNIIFRRSDDARNAVRARAQSMSLDQVNDPTPTLTRWFGEDLDAPPAQACRNWLTDVDPAGYKAAYSAFAEAGDPSDAELAGIGVPALFMTGADEPNSTPAMSHALASLVPNARAVIVRNAAHMAMMTHVAEVNAELETFLEDAR